MLINQIIENNKMQLKQKVFRILGVIIQKKRSLRAMKNELIAFNVYKAKHKCFKILKQNFLIRKERNQFIEFRVDEREIMCLAHVFRGWREYSHRRKMEKVKIAYLQTKRTMKIVESTFSRLFEEYMVRQVSRQIFQKLGRKDKQETLRSAFESWKNFMNLQVEKKIKFDQAQEAFEVSLKRKVWMVLAVLKTKRRYKDYQDSMARHFLLKQTFKGFLRGIFIQLEKRHVKIQGIRHYAFKLMMKSMFEWKRFTKNRFSMRYQKIMKPAIEENPTISDSSGFAEEKNSSINLYENSPYQETSFLYSKESTPWS